MTCGIDTQVHSKDLNVKLRSNDSRIFPNVYHNFFSDSRDYDMVIAAIHKMRDIFAFNPSVFIEEIFPGKEKTVEELRNQIFAEASTALHAVGTLSMGSSKEDPIDSNCSLRGVKSLRVVDASIWPYSTNGGTQALVFMLGEKCAQHIIDHY